MRQKRDRPYRGIFRKADGTRLGLDFWAENLTFARMHAEQVATDLSIHVEHGALAVVRIMPLPSDAESIREYMARPTGAWFPIDNEYIVVVSNIGTVYTGTDYGVATETFAEYVRLSQSGRGRAGYEEVILCKDGNPIREHAAIG